MSSEAVGMATVYLAEDVRHGRYVALKVLRPEVAKTLGPERFLREIRVAAHLTHPHIVALYDSGDADGFLYYVMPWVEGESLRHKLRREKHLRIEEAVSIARQVAAALEHAHALGVIHRDIKPGNILLHGDEALLTDFGIALALSGLASDRLTDTGISIGTLEYMSPEQATGEPGLDERSDLYSLGCVLYEMLAGEPPHSGPTPQAVLAKIATQQPASVRALRAAVPRRLETTVHQALEKRPVDRFESVHAFRQALSGAGSSQATPGPRIPRLASAAVLLAGLAVTGWWVLHGRNESAGEPAAHLDPAHIAVLYFDDFSPGGELGHLADGFTEALIHELTQVDRLRVTSRNGVKPYRNADVAIDSIARALSVGTLVEGSVEQQNDRLRVTVQLIDGRTGVHLLSNRVERAGSDLLALRDDIVREVADLLRQRLGEEIRIRERRSEAANDAAWERVQRAQAVRDDASELFFQGDAEGALRTLDRADSLLAAAAALSPDWIEPAIQRGRVAASRADWSGATGASYDSVRVFLREGLVHATNALALDAENAEALGLRGQLDFLAFNIADSWRSADSLSQSAERYLRSALANDPPRADVLSALSAVLQFTGRFREARQAAREALEADPFLLDARDVFERLCATSLELADIDRARSDCTEARQRFPDYPVFVGMQLLQLVIEKQSEPDLGGAWSLADTLMRLMPAPVRARTGPVERYLMAGILASAGLRDSAKHVLDRALATSPADVTVDGLYFIAWAHNSLGQRDSAIAVLRRYLAAAPANRAYIAADNAFAELHEDPRFHELVGGR